MKRLVSRYYKKGSVMFVAAGIFVALLILLGSFMKSTTSRVHVTKKLGDLSLAREFATSLAALSNHYLKNVELRDSASKLREALSTTFDDMKDRAEEDFKSKFQNCMSSKVKSGSDNILSVLEKNSGLNQLNWDIKWIVSKNDFTPILLDGKKSFPREKEGVIRVFIKISYLLPGTKSPINEDYMFVSQIRVTANLIPVLSKFTLYVDDALNGGDMTSLNVVRTLATGNLKTNDISKYRPWVLNNGKDSDIALDSYDELVKAPRGIVYLGGGTQDKPVMLGIARGWNTSGRGDYGEDFHFYRNSVPAEGYWKTIKLIGGNKGILAADIGLCDDLSDDNLRAWHQQLGEHYSNMARYNSIFRLFGTDGAKSPTLVLGYVNSMFASVRIFKSPPDSINFLKYLDHEESFLNGIGTPVDGSVAYQECELEALYSALGRSLSYEDYLEKYASKVGNAPYGKDYLYILTNNNVASPKSQVTDSKLKSLAGYSRNESDFTSIPSVYAELMSNAKLDDMSTFFDAQKLCIDGTGDDSQLKKRLAYYTSCESSEEDAENYLATYLPKKGILIDGELNLNGWLYINCPIGKTVDVIKCKVVSQGGIIVGGGGDINIKGDITCEEGAHLNLISLAGKIVVEKNVKCCDASLFACGSQVWLDGSISDPVLEINGNVAMKKIDKIEKLARGCKLNYKNSLAAMPGKGESDKNRSEYPLLMFNFKDNPKMYD